MNHILPVNMQGMLPNIIEKGFRGPKRLPILVGGTGLYYRALITG
ncbi:MAG: hypothetical protein Ct9H300mP21_03170 [Pseudomonadota bacterium]|nr:MAG: hypothetical protein Ct9H300mP21_03170 [Pseudomonadota bacterium]